MSNDRLIQITEIVICILVDLLELDGASNLMKMKGITEKELAFLGWAPDTEEDE